MTQIFSKIILLTLTFIYVNVIFFNVLLTFKTFKPFGYANITQLYVLMFSENSD